MTTTVTSPIDSLADALVAERRLIDDLLGVIYRQRDAVAADDLQAIEDSMFATHRLARHTGRGEVAPPRA